MCSSVHQLKPLILTPCHSGNNKNKQGFWSVMCNNVFYIYVYFLWVKLSLIETGIAAAVFQKHTLCGAPQHVSTTASRKPLELPGELLALGIAIETSHTSNMMICALLYPTLLCVCNEDFKHCRGLYLCVWWKDFSRLSPVGFRWDIGAASCGWELVCPTTNQGCQPWHDHLRNTFCLWLLRINILHAISPIFYTVIVVKNQHGLKTPEGTVQFYIYKCSCKTLMQLNLPYYWH